MPVEPRDVWRTLPAGSRREVVADLAAVLREVSHGFGTRQAAPPRPPCGGLRPPVHPAPGAGQPGEPAPAVRLRQRARELGWREADIEVIDADLGLSGGAATHRQGFKDLVARVTLGEVGLILSTEVTRLARNCSDWYPLLDVCGHRQCLIADRDGVYDPGSANGRLLLGLKGTISELELHTLRGRLTAGLLAKAARGELALQLPIGLVRDASGVVTKDPDREIQARIALVFATFLELRTAMAVMRTLQARGLALPRRDRHGDVRWRPATLPAIVGMLKNPAYAGMFVYGRTRPGPSATPGARPAQQPRRTRDGGSS